MRPSPTMIALAILALPTVARSQEGPAPSDQPPPVTVPKTESDEQVVKLTENEIAEIRKLPMREQSVALAQKVCPVSGEHLGSMGKPFKVAADDRVVFLCCEGCEEEFRAKAATKVVPEQKHQTTPTTKQTDKRTATPSEPRLACNQEEPMNPPPRRLRIGSSPDKSKVVDIDWGPFTDHFDILGWKTIEYKSTQFPGAPIDTGRRLALKTRAKVPCMMTLFKVRFYNQSDLEVTYIRPLIWDVQIIPNVGLATESGEHYIILFYLPPDDYTLTSIEKIKISYR